MEKRKRWHFWLIILVLALTLYNILPTIFYYAKPLDKPIGAHQAAHIGHQVAQRVDQLQPEAQSWIAALSKHLKVKPTSIQPAAGDPSLIEVNFASEKEAKKFAAVLPQAGKIIPFLPSRLTLGSWGGEQKPNSVFVERNLNVTLDPKQADETFLFSTKRTPEGGVAPLYRTVVYDRAIEAGKGLAGVSETALLAEAAQSAVGRGEDGPYIQLAQQIVDFDRLFGPQSSVTKRFYSSFSQSDSSDHAQLVTGLTTRLTKVKHDLQGQIAALSREEAKSDTYADPALTQSRRALEKQETTIEAALSILQTQGETFRSGATPLTEGAILAQLNSQNAALRDPSIVQVVEFGQRNPFFSGLGIDWERDQLTLTLHDDVRRVLERRGAGDEAAYQADKLNQMIINQVAYLARQTEEKITPAGDQYVVPLSELTNSQSFLALPLGKIAEQVAANSAIKLTQEWNPESTDLSAQNYPVMTYAEYQNASPEQQRLGFVVYAPSMEDGAAPAGFRPGSVYLIAKGLGTIVERASQAPNTESSKLLITDLQDLQVMLQEDGFVGYSGASFGLPEEFKNDFIFELDGYYQTLLAGTREEFAVHGSKRFATLEFTDLGQRIRTINQIETAQHEDLLKWRDEYRAAQVSLDPSEKLNVPKPTQNAVWSNFILSAKKYFRGDDRKILKWGLDLSGGKTVTIGLRNQNGQPVTDPDDLRQAVNELYQRVNKMGVSEVEIRVEGSNIVLNFPGAQGWSAKELIKASTMTFHIVNEKFGVANPALAASVDRFLQEVWNEAVVTNRKDIDSLNEIAWRQLGEDFEEEGVARPRSEAARTLYDNGLRLASPQNRSMSSTFDDSLSRIAMQREADSAAQGEGHPLLVVFNNYVLEGSSLRNVQAQYDPSKGNVLVFDVASSATLPDGTVINPSSDFYLWTSQFAESKIGGTPNEQYSRGRGWRMAVVLNDAVINAPSLHDALRDHAMISGSFSQREVNQLAADLKAGSLSFTPKILSEKNVSPDLGHEERVRAITAAIIGILLVAATMISYYRFAGLVASIAVIINLLIMWGILQNLEAALTLPGIAGVILTVGMSVDANVLVFERIREEFAQSGRIASAIQTGYRKAFSAIFDSNITTIIAALILMHFDSGPIKGFAVTLIVGIISSMFTALFMTRYFFAGWVQNPKNTQLKMANLFRKTNFNFLSKARMAVILSSTLIVIGAVMLLQERNTMFGMDFTGGYSLTVELQEQPEDSYRIRALDALHTAGATGGEIQIRELNRPNHLLIQLGSGMEEEGHPFWGLPLEATQAAFDYSYQSNPRIVWVVDALQTQGLAIRFDSLPRLEGQWTLMSGQFSDAMRNNALLALGLALISILLYITVRFEFKYAISAIIALAHDVLITIGAMAILHRFGVPVQIDLQAVGAIMTIVGYSLNDTIIIFDRIREDSRILRKLKFSEMINHALNVTLNRTLMTSGTTVLVLIALVALGGSAIFSFALVMTLGVVFGTFSSLFIASPALLYFHGREERGASKSETSLSKA
jgi:SecD/SecF fusion protein